MKVRTGLTIILSIFFLLGNSAVTFCSTANNVPAPVNTPASKIAAASKDLSVSKNVPVQKQVTASSNIPVSVIASVPLNIAHQQTILAEIVSDKGSDMKVINDPVLALDEYGCIYEPLDKTAPLEIYKYVEITADNITLADTVINGNLYIYADNIVLRSLNINGTLFISPGIAVRLDKVTSDSIEVIAAEKMLEEQSQDTVAISDVSATLNDLAEADAQGTPATLPASAEPAPPSPVAAQPKDLSQAPEIANVSQLPEESKATRAYLEIASINDTSSRIVIVNKERSLPASWKPNDLVKLQVTYKGRAEARYMRKEAADALTKLFAKAKSESVELCAVSGFRSYNLQNTVFTKYTDMLGIPLAQRVSAKPGQSEHQTGLAIDISSKSMNYALSEAFEKTREGKWLTANAAEFGFILRYPKYKEPITGYDFEPWHFRYVGKDIAADIMKKGLTLEEYFNLVNAELS